MRINRLFALVAVVSLLVVPSSLLASTTTSDASTAIKATPSRVCNPKKPTTCRTAELTTVMETAAIINSAVCVGPRWHCRTQTLAGGTSTFAQTNVTVTPQAAEKQATIINSAVCVGPRWHCKAQTLVDGTASFVQSLDEVTVAPQVEEKQATIINSAVCVGPRWHCAAQTLS